MPVQRLFSGLNNLKRGPNPGSLLLKHSQTGEWREIYLPAMSRECVRRYGYVRVHQLLQITDLGASCSVLMCKLQRADVTTCLEL